MGRTRPDHRDRIVALLTQRGPMRFVQIMQLLEITDRRELDYDLRCLRQENMIHSQPSSWWALT